jgi:hypothetical protein
MASKYILDSSKTRTRLLKPTKIKRKNYMDISSESLQASSVLAWITLNNFVNENQQPIEFKDHRFMIDIYADESVDIVCRKSAQVGWSVAAILRCLWLLKYAGLNIIYVLPTNNVVQDFVKPKVDPLISGNKAIADTMGSDSVSQKKVGDRFIYFKGGFSQREAISITGDVLVIDEYDRMPSMEVVNTFDSRLQASKNPRRWRFSNPSQIGFGVDGLYNESDQMHWIITCHHCKHRSYIDFEQEEEWLPHYVNQDEVFYACGKCHKELSDSDRRGGEWLARYPDRPRRGYWINQMMAPWVTAKRIMEQKEESGIEFFYNFVLGKAYTPSDMVVDRSAILRATAPSNIQKTHVAIGVDQDAGGQYYVAMTPQGVFAHGYVDSWDKIEHLKLMYNAVVVCDPNPYQAIPKQMTSKYSDWYNCYFKTLESQSAIQWKDKEQVVYADRTRIIDLVANEIVNARMLFRERPHELEDYIAHWNNIYRTTEEKDDGKIRSIWMKKEGKQSDYPFANVYARIGLSLILGSESELMEPTQDSDTPITNLEAKDNKTISVDMSDIINDTMADMQ